MADPIGRLEVEISANAEPLKQGLNQAQQEAARAGRTIESGVNNSLRGTAKEIQNTVSGASALSEAVGKVFSIFSRVTGVVGLLTGAIYGTVKAADALAEAFVAPLRRLREAQQEAAAFKDELEASARAFDTATSGSALDKQRAALRKEFDERRKANEENAGISQEERDARLRDLDEEELRRGRALVRQQRERQEQQRAAEEQKDFDRQREQSARRRREAEEALNSVIEKSAEQQLNEKFDAAVLAQRALGDVGVGDEEIRRRIALIEEERVRRLALLQEEQGIRLDNVREEYRLRASLQQQLFNDFASSLSGFRVGGSDRQVIAELRRISRNTSRNAERRS